MLVGAMNCHLSTVFIGAFHQSKVDVGAGGFAFAISVENDVVGVGMRVAIFHQVITDIAKTAEIISRKGNEP